MDFCDCQRKGISQEQRLQALVEIDVVVCGPEELERVQPIDEKVEKRLPDIVVASVFER